MLKDVLTCSNKSYFFGCLIVHALKLEIEPITGKGLNISEPVLNRVQNESSFDIKKGIQHLREHFRSAEFVFRQNDLHADITHIFKNQMCGRVVSFF
jgi:hypothetical protein